jgi:hypothetical protein
MPANNNNNNNANIEGPAGISCLPGYSIPKHLIVGFIIDISFQL